MHIDDDAIGDGRTERAGERQLQLQVHRLLRSNVETKLAQGNCVVRRGAASVRVKNRSLLQPDLDAPHVLFTAVIDHSSDTDGFP